MDNSKEKMKYVENIAENETYGAYFPQSNNDQLFFVPTEIIWPIEKVISSWERVMQQWEKLNTVFSD